jgi:hypothetical protein
MTICCCDYIVLTVNGVIAEPPSLLFDFQFTGRGGRDKSVEPASPPRCPGVFQLIV